MQQRDNNRRTFLSATSSAVMACGLAGGYATLACMAGAFLYPARPRELAWLFVAEIGRVQPGESFLYTAAGGETVTIARRADAGTLDGFLALSSTCPHLGCQVHWEPQNNRFFCPCHNGVFDADGNAVAGPPAEAGQSLPRYPLHVEDGLLFIQMASEQLQTGTAGSVATQHGIVGIVGGDSATEDV